jgi:hypothetical protein
MKQRQRQGLGKKQSNIIEEHVGELLTAKLKELHVTNIELARRINRPHSAIAPMRKQPSMQAYMLWEVSVALKYDFFSALSESMHRLHPEVSSATASDKAVIASLEKELAAVKEERDYLKKMIDILAKK